MYAEERQQAIGTMVSQRGRMSVAALSETFGVTTETVRRDLAFLERIGQIRRVHGGAVPTGSLHVTEPGMAERDQTRAQQKDRIARCAVTYLPPTGGSVIFDAGTTTGRMIPELPTENDFTAVTNSVPIGARLASMNSISLILLGGRVRGVDASRGRRGRSTPAEHVAGRRRLRRNQRDQRRARTLHPGQRRGRRQTSDGQGRQSRWSWWPIPAKSAAST